MAGRILGLDVGTKTIGVAKSDPLGHFAQPLLTLSRKGVQKDVILVTKVDIKSTKSRL